MVEVPSLKDFLENNNYTARLYFNNRISDREKAKSTIVEIPTVSNPLNLSPFLVLNDSAAPIVHLIRNKNEVLTFIKDYNTSHITSSLIANILFGDSSVSTKTILDSIVFTWYYYWYILTDWDISNITHNVCFQLEEMIKTLIMKELTLYRKYNTAEAIRILRQRLNSERLVNLGSLPLTVNLRR